MTSSTWPAPLTMDMLSSGGPDTDRLMAMLRDYEASGRNPTMDGIPDDMQARQRCCRCLCASEASHQSGIEAALLPAINGHGTALSSYIGPANVAGCPAAARPH